MSRNNRERGVKSRVPQMTARYDVTPNIRLLQTRAGNENERCQAPH